MAQRWSELKASARRREIAARLVAGAAELRRRAQQDSLAGMHGNYVANALAAAMEDVSRRDPEDGGPGISDLLAACHHLLDGPDGVNDHSREGVASRLMRGPGH